MGSKCRRGALCRPSPGSWLLAFHRHLQALGPGWGWDVLIPPCWHTEQKDGVWFQLKGQGAEGDARPETPFLYLLRVCGVVDSCRIWLQLMAVYGVGERALGCGARRTRA